LKQLWAKLLANAMDQSRANRVRGDFIAAARKMEPLDATVLTCVHTRRGNADGEARNAIAVELSVTRDEVDVSVANLIKLELLMLTNPPNSVMSSFGREFLRAIED